MEQLAAAYEHLAQVGAPGDLTDLVPDPVGDQRRASVVQHDALFAIDPARTLVDLGLISLAPNGVMRLRSPS